MPVLALAAGLWTSDSMFEPAGADMVIPITDRQSRERSMLALLHQRQGSAAIATKAWCPAGERAD
jgi:hypothetical protein